jgi:hypothetical protein
MSERLSIADLETFDPGAPDGRVQKRYWCPFCGHDKPKDAGHRCLTLNVETGAWNCKRCKKTGLLVERQTRRPAREIARENLRKQAEIEDKPKAMDPTRQASFQRQKKGIKPLTPEGIAYLEGRGIPAEITHAARVKFAPHYAEEPEKGTKGFPAVVFSIRNESGDLVAFQGRAIKGDAKITYGDKSLGVFSTPGAFDSPTMILVESPINALSFSVCGFPAIALCGTEGWPSWLPAKAWQKSVYLAQDADEPDAQGTRAGDHAAARLAEAIGTYSKPNRLRPPPPFNDWNDVLRTWGIERMTEGLRPIFAEREAPLPPAGTEADSLRARIEELSTWCTNTKGDHPDWVTKFTEWEDAEARLKQLAGDQAEIVSEESTERMGMP